MEILIKNTFTKTEDWIRECNKFLLFCRPIVVSFHILCLLVLCWGIWKVLFLHIVDVLLLFIPFWWFFVILILYFRMNKITIGRNDEIYGKNGEVVSEVTQDSIKQVHSNGAQYQIYYDTIKRGYLTQNYILLHSKANVLYTLKRDGFSVGSAEEFLAFMRDKGIKIK